jgi:hypothetical protein
MRHHRPTAPDESKVVRLFEKGLTREEVAARMNRKDSARLYQMWLNARGCPTPRMLMVEKMERFGF